MNIRHERKEVSSEEPKNIEQSHLFKDGSRINWLHPVVPESALAHYAYAFAILQKKVLNGSSIQFVPDEKLSREAFRLKKFQLAIDLFSKCIELLPSSLNDELAVFKKQISIIFGPEHTPKVVDATLLIEHIQENIQAVEKEKLKLISELQLNKLFKPVSSQSPLATNSLVVSSQIRQ